MLEVLTYWDWILSAFELIDHLVSWVSLFMLTEEATDVKFSLASL